MGSWHALPVPVYRQTDFTPKWVVVSRLHDTVARFRTGVKFSPRCENRGELTPGDSRRHNILWWYPVNKYRAMRGNRSELAPGLKSPRCSSLSCKHPLSLGCVRLARNPKTDLTSEKSVLRVDFNPDFMDFFFTVRLGNPKLFS